MGTHDNATLEEWRNEVTPENIAYAAEYLGLNEKEGFAGGIMRSGMGSVAVLFIAQMQDYLSLGAEARMNTPGTLGQNWKWRLLKEQWSIELAVRLRSMARLYGRLIKE